MMPQFLLNLTTEMETEEVEQHCELAFKGLTLRIGYLTMRLGHLDSSNDNLWKIIKSRDIMAFVLQWSVRDGATITQFYGARI